VMAGVKAIPKWPMEEADFISSNNIPYEIQLLFEFTQIGSK
jgi:hypothetical protein